MRLLSSERWEEEEELESSKDRFRIFLFLAFFYVDLEASLCISANIASASYFISSSSVLFPPPSSPLISYVISKEELDNDESIDSSSLIASSNGDAPVPAAFSFSLIAVLISSP